MSFRDIIENVGLVIDGLGVAVIVIGLLVATILYLFKGIKLDDGYKQYRQNLGRGILLGLELLVAADIIRTVGVTPTLEGVLVLGVIVLIRTFLSMSIEVELEGRWPWRARAMDAANANNQAKDTARPV